MNAASSPPNFERPGDDRQKPERPVIVTVLAWVMMAAGLLGLPISVITFLMIMVRSYGTEHNDPIGYVIIVFGPALMVLTGIGLLRRWPVLRFGIVLGLAGMCLVVATVVAFGPRLISSFKGSSRQTNVVIGSNDHLVPIPSGVPPDISHLNRMTFPSRTWRVGHRGRDMMYYEEQIGGTWERIDIDGEMLMGRAHHVIYFKSPEDWKRYPEWARDRRAEIIARIKSEFREPDYEYHQD